MKVKAQFSRWWSVFFPLIGLLLIPEASRAASDRKLLEQKLKQAYLGKIVTIRHFYSGEKLEYNAEGKLLKGGEPGPWTLHGQIEITGVKLRRKRLLIKGKRVLQFYDAQLKQFQRLAEPVLWVQVDAKLDMTNERDLTRTLSRIFLSWGEKLYERVPFYWKDFLRGREQEESAPRQTGQQGGGCVYRVADGVSPPRVLSRREPKYTVLARSAGLEGTVVLSTIVRKDGSLEILRIVRSLGLGLDDNAIEAMKRWRFHPGRKNGNPVDVALNIEVNFILKRNPR